MTPRFKDVPQHWKHPEGPYRQAPAEYGGEWWLVNPFGSATPWLTQSRPSKPEILPPGFEEIFGARPRLEAFLNTPNPSFYLRIAVGEWEQNLKHFKGVGVPEWADPQDVINAQKVFEGWGMGEPRYFEGRYGWTARFPESQVADFDTAALAAIQSTHLVVAQYQLALLEMGITPEKKHPFVPPHVWPDEKEQ